MYKKEFFELLLLVSIVSTAIFASFAWAPVSQSPSISVSTSTGGALARAFGLSYEPTITVTGVGWNPGLPVTVYWDQQNANHTIAVVTPSAGGSFSVDQLEVEGVSIGTHMIIAVQETFWGVLHSASASYTVTTTSPPDDRTLDAIQQIENKLGNQASNYTTIITNIDSVNETLDKWFDAGGQYNNTAQVQSFGDVLHITSSGTVLDWHLPFPGWANPVSVVLTLQVSALDAGEYVTIFRYIGGNSSFRHISAFDIVIASEGIYTYNFAAPEFRIIAQCTNGFYLEYSVVVTYPPPA